MDLNKICSIDKNVTMLPHKTVIINSEKWNSILKHLKQEAIQQSEEERSYQEYLKNSSKEMTSKWMNSIEKAHENKIFEKKMREQEKIEEGERRFKELTESEEKIRMEKVLEAQKMRNQLKLGTQSLKSAALLCEALQAREIQCNFNTEMRKSAKERKAKEGEKYLIQCARGLDEQQCQMMKAKKKNDDYKMELYRMAREIEECKKEKRQRKLEDEKRENLQIKNEIDAQIAEEQALKQKKKESMQKNALEALQMVEERRKREQIEEDIDNKIMQIFAKGKQNIADIKRDKERKKIEEMLRIKDAIAQRVFVAAADRSAQEEEAIKKALREADKKAEQQEMDRINRANILKASRIEEHNAEIEREKIEKAKQLEQIRWSIANRLKNEEVTQDVEKLRVQENLKRTRQIRAALLEQIKEREENDQKRRQEDLLCLNPEDAVNDNNFIEYACNLIEDAKMKQRTILPLMRSVNQYKKMNGIGVGEKSHDN